MELNTGFIKIITLWSSQISCMTFKSDKMPKICFPYIVVVQKKIHNVEFSANSIPHQQKAQKGEAKKDRSKTMKMQNIYTKLVLFGFSSDKSY